MISVHEAARVVADVAADGKLESPALFAKALATLARHAVVSWQTGIPCPDLDEPLALAAANAYYSAFHFVAEEWCVMRAVWTTRAMMRLRPTDPVCTQEYVDRVAADLDAARHGFFMGAPLEPDLESRCMLAATFRTLEPETTLPPRFVGLAADFFTWARRIELELGRLSVRRCDDSGESLSARLWAQTSILVTREQIREVANWWYALHVGPGAIEAYQARYAMPFEHVDLADVLDDDAEESKERTEVVTDICRQAAVKPKPGVGRESFPAVLADLWELSLWNRQLQSVGNFNFVELYTVLGPWLYAKAGLLKQPPMHRRPRRPIVLFLRGWFVLDKGEAWQCGSVAAALLRWQALVRERYDGKLENEMPLDRLCGA